MNVKIELDDIPLIHALYKEGLTQKEIAKKFEVTNAHISKILRGLVWTKDETQKEVAEKAADPLNNHCACGSKAVIFEGGKYECGTCWAEPRKKYLNSVKHLKARA